MEILRGTVKNLVFVAPDDKFCVFKMNPFDNPNSLIIATGKVPSPAIGQEVSMNGSWTEHPKFGKQFAVQNFGKMMKPTCNYVQKFLESGVLKYVGQSIGKRIFETFGADSLKIIEAEPHKLSVVKGITEQRAIEISRSYSSLGGMRELIIFLEGHDCPSHYAKRIYKKYEDKSVAKLKKNPYVLAEEVDGIGFLSADKIAISLGIKEDSEDRIASGIKFLLSEASHSSGDVYLFRDDIIKQGAKLLNQSMMLIENTLDNMLEKNDLVSEPNEVGKLAIYHPSLYKTECLVASHLKRLINVAQPLVIPDEKDLLDKWEQKTKFSLSSKQRDAVIQSTKTGVFVLTGGPGTGKTTVMKAITDAFDSLNQKIELCAPTGRAAKRLSEATGREAKTIHRLLEYSKNGYKRNEDNPLESDVVVVDESSMIDIFLMSSLLKALSNKTRLILVGDSDQLPSVGAGSVLRDAISSGVINVVKLDEIFRQAATSPVVVNAHKVNVGKSPDFKNQDFTFIEAETPENALEIIERVCRDRLPKEGYDAIKDVQVLVPMYKGTAGVTNLNSMLRDSLNPANNIKKQISLPYVVYREGDKVLQTRNNYDKGVFNGDVGYVTSVEEDSLVVSYPDGDVVYERNELEEITPAFASTIHKSQGSEYPVVVMALMTSHFVLLQRNLVYTGITRAKKKVIIVGNKKALWMAIKNDKVKKRNSLLSERLRKEN